MTRYAMVIDQRRCIGCHSCTVACRTWNDLPLDIIYNPVVTEGAQGKWPHVHRTYTPTLCMHCANPECVPCCPTGASQQDDDGVVWVDSKKCMACRCASTPAPTACVTPRCSARACIASCASAPSARTAARRVRLDAVLRADVPPEGPYLR